MTPLATITSADRDRWIPTYYCEDCGVELTYPPLFGRCAACDEKREEFLASTEDPRR